jgi:hypothetical protein
MALVYTTLTTALGFLQHDVMGFYPLLITMPQGVLNMSEGVNIYQDKRLMQFNDDRSVGVQQ